MLVYCSLCVCNLFIRAGNRCRWPASVKLVTLLYLYNWKEGHGRIAAPLDPAEKLPRAEANSASYAKQDENSSLAYVVKSKQWRIQKSLLSRCLRLRLKTHRFFI